MLKRNKPSPQLDAERNFIAGAASERCKPAGAAKLGALLSSQPQRPLFILVEFPLTPSALKKLSSPQQRRRIFPELRGAPHWGDIQVGLY